MRILVTRPAAQAVEWVRQLRAAGHDAHALPLIEIAPAADSAALAQAWQTLPSQALVVFVSPNAALHFFDGREGSSWPVGVPAASPGPGTTRVLRRLGVSQVIEPPADAPQFDSEALWQQLSSQSWSGRSVLIVRGGAAGSGRDGAGRSWLADRLREHGARVHFVAAYRRTSPTLGADDQALLAQAQADASGHLWFFSSSEAIDHLAALAPAADWSAAIAVTTHPRIAERARRLGMGRVAEARPGLDAVLSCIQSIAS